MNLLLILFFCICIAIIIVVVPIQLRRQREFKRQTNLNEHFKMLSEGVDRITHQSPDLTSNLEDHAPSGTTHDIWGFPPEKDTVIEEIRIADEGYVEWDYVVHIHEGTEQYLGAFHFQSLEERFSKILGIEACKHEDREIFLIRAKGLSVDSLRNAIWDEFLATAKVSHDG